MAARGDRTRAAGRNRFLAVLALSLGGHGLAVTLLLAGLKPSPAPWAEPAPLDIRLLRPVRAASAAPQTPGSAASRVRQTRSPPSEAGPSKAISPSEDPPINLPRNASAGPGAEAGGGPPIDDGLPPGLRAGLRRQLGCGDADFYGLTAAEREACAERLDVKRDGPLLAVISPEKKAIFDGECAKDDAWCLYRVGKGPYPGLFSLLRKK
ncbi:MAG: hypothetical protein KF842_08345 [Caulobacter sp.]|nr:hypothetical protein [Caulobacter sp.]